MLSRILHLIVCYLALGTVSLDSDALKDPTPLCLILSNRDSDQDWNSGGVVV